ncbi:hypothetical protein BDV3_005830 [Batrachochytrium dendrobatidis]|nr:Tectonin beta-propeller repeat-containing protein 1 [Batrachochytrium dendrobatidis]KAK5665949.1 Tectonin beta-propeller repeat-containing protein 1 [Batrachochytrium dendrobatidis]OAJ40900.1 hypothetical protein, variant [Batrachochytrium dendrobatidis JEL423]
MSANSKGNKDSADTGSGSSSPLSGTSTFRPYIAGIGASATGSAGMSGLRDMVAARQLSTTSTASTISAPPPMPTRQKKLPPSIPTRPLSAASHSSSSASSSILSPTSHGAGTALRAAKMPDIVCDVIYENQRGTSLFGAPKFSKKSLLPTDFPAYSDKQGGFVVDLKLFQCRPTWEWVSDWMVDMNGDVDQEGWCYGLQFISDKWSGTCRTSHYVRRRKWIRMRRMKGASSATSGSLPSATATTPTGSVNGAGANSLDELIVKMQRARIDRERITDLKNYLLLADSPTFPPSKIQLLIAQCDHECSKLRVALLLAPRMELAQEQAIVSILQGLKFYSDRVEFLKATSLTEYQTMLSKSETSPADATTLLS